MFVDSNDLAARSVRTCVIVALVAIAAQSLRAQSTFDQAGRTGVSLAGAEFGVESATFSNLHPGTSGSDYVFNSPQTIQYFRSRGVRLVRLPFRWERIQPALGRRLDESQLEQLRKFCRSAEQAGVYVLLDVHNYGRYRIELDGRVHESVIDAMVDSKVLVSRYHFADLWRRLAVAFRSQRSVIGYGLMNEPHDMGDSSWQQISQAAVSAIRKVDKRKAIIVAGDEWSTAERFPQVNGNTPWIRDPANNIVYEAHCYFDHDASGKYVHSFAAEWRRDPMLAHRGELRAKPFLDWCKANKVRGFVGEFGTPPDPEWKEVTQRFIKLCARYHVPVCYWAAGEWWGDYPLSIHPRNEFSLDAPQLNWMQSSRTAGSSSTARRRVSK